MTQKKKKKEEEANSIFGTSMLKEENILGIGCIPRIRIDQEFAFSYICSWPAYIDKAIVKLESHD